MLLQSHFIFPFKEDKLSVCLPEGTFTIYWHFVCSSFIVLMCMLSFWFKQIVHVVPLGSLYQM